MKILFFFFLSIIFLTQSFAQVKDSDGEKKIANSGLMIASGTTLIIVSLPLIGFGTKYLIEGNYIQRTTGGMYMGTVNNELRGSLLTSFGLAAFIGGTTLLACGIKTRLSIKSNKSNMSIGLLNNGSIGLELHL